MIVSRGRNLNGTFYPKFSILEVVFQFQFFIFLEKFGSE